MERMTQEMHQIAEKTKKETVVMRIITVVTLIFLPGTFISTLMSTDIVSFGTNDSTSSGQKHGTFSKAAFELYLKITIPLMVCTFILAYGAFKWLSSMDKNRRNEDEWQNSPEAKV
ncbi:hypothetical protein UCRPC4_g03182 [Phaeomoniella chlamydospora]|uniref:Uncharacterized protein n=1 Tax=Phaeomoniella chlamydospora TaxID=158046 RepID=A0A0G2H1J9_PHACM|nr:hypothetical protein UCRPC4_g03182 [Phaeomoniella chlamydospora]